MIEEIIENKRLELIAELITLTEANKIGWDVAHDKADYECQIRSHNIEIKTGPNAAGDKQIILAIYKNGPLRSQFERFTEEDFSHNSQNATQELGRLYGLAKLKADKVEENLDFMLAELRSLAAPEHGLENGSGNGIYSVQTE